MNEVTIRDPFLTLLTAAERTLHDSKRGQININTELELEHAVAQCRGRLKLLGLIPDVIEVLEK